VKRIYGELFIDPGSSLRGPGCACAAFVDERLTASWFERFTSNVRASEYTRHTFPRGLGLNDQMLLVVWEQPVTQGGRTRAARPEDLMRLTEAGALLAGAYAGRDGAPVIAWPASDANGVRGWKGSEAKPANHRRLWEILDPAERALLGGDATGRAILAACEKGALCRWSKPGADLYPRTFTTHNLLDACAMGATYYGRMKRSG
jgi:transposase